MRNNHRTCSFVLAVGLANIAGASAVAQDNSAHTIAAAKILETKGDVAGAVRVLRQAMVGAPAESQPVLNAQLSRLVGDEAASGIANARSTIQSQGTAQDPVDRLIRVLNTGDQTPETRSAIQQLRMLGNLVVPHLIRAFPELGPFGVMNALEVMRSTRDPRVGEFLAGQVKTAAPEVVTAIVWALDELPEATALRVAAEIVGGDFSESHELGALRVFFEHQSESKACVALKQKLLSSKDAQTRTSAAMRAISARQMTEAEAIAVVKTLSPKQVRQVAVYAHDDSWVKFGVLCFPPAGKRHDIGSYVNQFSWWRAPEEAAPLLLDVTAASNQVKAALRSMIDHGWRVPAALDDAFHKFAAPLHRDGWALFLDALPADGEDRAIRAWQKNERSRHHLMEAMHHTDRSWVRLAVRDLVAATSLRPYGRRSFQFDWNEAPKVAIAGLVQFAQKWPEVSPGESNAWADGLVEAYESWSALPVDVVKPLFASGYQPAWVAVQKRHPELLLSLVRDLKRLPVGLVAYPAAQFRRHGTEADVPTAIRILRMPVPGGYHAQAAEFLGHMAKGSVEVLGLLAVPFTLEPQSYVSAKRMGDAVARGVNVEDLPAILELLPRLPHWYASRVCHALANQVNESHVEALASALQKCYGSEWRDTIGKDRDEGAIGNRTLALRLLELLGSTHSEAALPHLRRVFENGELSPHMIRTAAAAALNVDGAARRELLQQMLQSKRTEVVVAAVQAQDLRTDAELRAQAFASVLGIATEENGADAIFGVLEPGDQLTLALKLLDHKDIASFDQSLVGRALDLIDGRKDSKYLAQLTRASQHSNSGIRWKVADILGRTFVRDSVDPLLELLKDDAGEVRAAAQQNLDQIANYLDERAKWERRFGKVK